MGGRADLQLDGGDSTMTRLRHKGFSLVEVLISMAIGSLIAGGVVALLLSQAQLTATQNRNIINQENVRDVVHFITDEIALANTYDATEPVIAANDSEVSFFADIDGDNVTDTIAFYVDESSNLRRSFQSPANGGMEADDIILRNVQSFTFTYYAADDAAPATIDEITSVELQLVLNTSGGTTYTSGKQRPQSMVGRATIRNKLLN